MANPQDLHREGPEQTHSPAKPTGVFLAFVLSLLFITLAGLPALFFGEPDDNDYTTYLPTLFSFAFAWILLALWVIFRERRPFTSIGLRTKRPGSRCPLVLP